MKSVGHYCVIMLLIMVYLSHVAQAQIITTIDSMNVSEIQCMAIDPSGNLYVTTFGNQIKKVDIDYNVTVIAGTGTSGFSGDRGLAINAELYYPLGITTDSIGNIFFADAKNNRIRKIDVSTGIITTIAGNGYGAPYSGSYSGDSGIALAAELYYPAGVVFDDSGNLLIADAQNYRIRKITTDGIIHTVVGNGLQGSIGDGGSAIDAECWPTEGMVIDNLGNLYFTQNITYPTVRKVNADGIISTIAGDTVSHTYNGDDIAATSAYMNAQYLALSPNNLLYLCDEAANNRVRYIDNFGIIHTVVGNGVAANTGDGGIDTAAEINGPTAIVFDTCGNLYIADFGGNSIRKVAFNPTCTPSLQVPQALKNEIVIYPNPAYESINVDNISSEEGYELFNITGIIEQKGVLKPGNNSIGIAPLPPGIYLLQLTGNTGSKTIHKIIKQ